MTNRDDAYRKFDEAFGLNENGIPPGPMTAVKAGVELVRDLANPENDIVEDPEILASEIAAIGHIIGQYAVAKSTPTVKFDHWTKLRLEGMVGSVHPSRLQVKLTGPDLQIRKKFGNLASRFKKN